MSFVVILRGISGSGKSYFIRNHFSRYTPVVSADHFFETFDGGYEFDPSKLTEAHADCFRRFLDLLAADRPLVVVDNTNTKAWEISPYVQAAQAHGYEHVIVTLTVDPDVAVERNLHGTPEETVRAMHENLMNAELPPHWNAIWIGQKV